MRNDALLLVIGASAVVTAKTAVVVPGWPKLPFPFSTALTSRSGTLWISGMQGIDFTKPPPALVPGGITEQTKQTLANIETVVHAAGGTMDNILECTVLLADLKDFKAMNSAYATFFTDGLPPVRVALEAALAGGALVEIKCTGEIAPK
jgi:2-iminobutanoate/2-iminopropanoate deaminase